MDDIHRMNEELPYLDAVVNESLRLIPPLGMLNRLTCSDEGNKHSFQLVNGLKIPKNYSVSLSIKAIHCNPEIWGEDCERFVPERWIQMKQPPMTMPSSSSYGTTSPSSVHSPTGISPAIELPQTSEIFNMGESIPPMTKKEEKLIPTEDEKQRNQSWCSNKLQRVPQLLPR
ncbi:hypothetical protein C9374_002499 [Naegleria lovaniensis]|uniref:Cytochrome P450 n=1 Tax=Naegleria lovaniensis TaxID=51637 RepID=A0AA88KKG2_NAELO|nr:uncharacterized protein C9374_002499 [Naegleria lovaniensis]KAG2386755.1 hypothetical protein C9374_002499 [Naegleria lovaniensis]